MVCFVHFIIANNTKNTVLQVFFILSIFFYIPVTTFFIGMKIAQHRVYSYTTREEEGGIFWGRVTQWRVYPRSLSKNKCKKNTTLKYNVMVSNPNSFHSCDKKCITHWQLVSPSRQSKFLFHHIRSEFYFQPVMFGWYLHSGCFKYICIKEKKWEEERLNFHATFLKCQIHHSSVSIQHSKKLKNRAFLQSSVVQWKLQAKSSICIIRTCLIS